MAKGRGDRGAARSRRWGAATIGALLLTIGCGGDGNEAVTDAPVSSRSVTTSTSQPARKTTTTTTTTTTTAPPKTTTTAPPPTTLPPTTAPPTTQPPVTTQPRLTIAGEVTFLDRSGVWFDGNTDGGQAHQPPADGSPCQGYDGYADLSAGGSVIVTDGSGLPLATTTLGGGTTVQEVRGTEAERTAREDLLDAIYGLRSAYAYGDPVRVAELNLERADLRVADQQAGGLPGFEGHPFRATWCRVSFTVNDLPPLEGYQFTVTHRGTTTFTRSEIEADGGRVLLAVG